MAIRYSKTVRYERKREKERRYKMTKLVCRDFTTDESNMIERFIINKKQTFE